MAGLAPPVHQIAVGAGGFAPVSRVGQLLRLFNQFGLGGLGLSVALRQVGEEVTLGAVESGASRRETLPQRVFGGLIDAWTAALSALPIIEEFLEGITGLAPLNFRRIGRGQLFGRFDDLCALSDSHFLGSLPLGLNSRAPFSCSGLDRREELAQRGDRKSTRLNSSHVASSYAVFCLKK